MTKNKYLSLFLILLITFVASAIGGFTTASFKEPWYSEIILPSFNPPSWVFGPVWTILYVFMSVAAWSTWKKTLDKKSFKKKSKKKQFDQNQKFFSYQNLSCFPEVSKKTKYFNSLVFSRGFQKAVL